MTLECSFKGSADEVFLFFMDVKKFGSVHPYITSVEETPEGFKISETINFLGIKNRNEYVVKVSTPTATNIVYTSQIKQNVFAEITFGFQEKSGRTILTETIQIQASWPTNRILGSVMKSAHLKLFKNLAEILG